MARPFGVRKMITMLATEQRHDLWTRSYRLAHCEGYAVQSRHGAVGYVEDVIPPPELGEPEALRIRVGSGRSCRLALVPIDLVRDVFPEAERIVIDEVPSEPRQLGKEH